MIDLRKVFTAYVMLTALDLGTTVYAVNYLGFYELNPLMRYLVTKPSLLIVTQLAFMVINYVILRIAYMLRTRHKVLSVAYRIVCIIYLSRILPVINNFLVLMRVI